MIQYRIVIKNTLVDSLKKYLCVFFTVKIVFHLCGHITFLSLVSARVWDFLLLPPPTSEDSGLDAPLTSHQTIQGEPNIQAKGRKCPSDPTHGLLRRPATGCHHTRHLFPNLILSSCPNMLPFTLLSSPAPVPMVNCSGFTLENRCFHLLQFAWSLQIISLLPHY